MLGNWIDGYRLRDHLRAKKAKGIWTMAKDLKTQLDEKLQALKEAGASKQLFEATKVWFEKLASKPVVKK
jgi:hypothetical protein